MSKTFFFGSPPVPETVLVVEDDSALRDLVEGILRAKGYDLLTASNAQEALRTVRERVGKQIDLVFTDIKMPGMDGKEMAERLIKSIPSLKVLFTSGYPDDEIPGQDGEDKRIKFLSKPYSPEILVRTVRQFLDQKF
jgi:two-component system cell cycle sensor histidine kinase/response regulator CckA